MEEPFADATKDMDIFIFPHHGLEPFTVGERTLRHINPTLVLVPGSGSGGVYNYCSQNHMSPVIRSSADGNLVVLCDGISWQLYENVAPGAFAGMTGQEESFPDPGEIQKEETP